MDAYAIAVVRMGLPPAEFWTMPPPVFRVMLGQLREKEQAADYRAGVIAAVTHNSGLGAKEPRGPEHYFPHLKPEPAHQAPAGTDEAEVAALVMRAWARHFNKTRKEGAEA